MPDAALPDTTMLTESFWDPNVREQLVTTCTSGTRPSGVEGRIIYETDTDRLLVYNGSAWRQFAIASGGVTVTGSTTGTTDGSGNLTITWGVTFASAPRITVTPNSTNWSQGYISSVSTTGAVFRCINAAGSNVTSVSVTAQWIAVGQLA